MYALLAITYNLHESFWSL